MVFEFKIRDYLADNLEILEPGLQCLRTELPLQNPEGANGFVDIFARDCFGNRVIVEIKRSDTAARSALHELYKYLAILRTRQGISLHKLRCFVVSTEWHELFVPFSEFVRTAPYQAQGFRIQVDDSGAVLSADPISVDDGTSAPKLFRHHDIFLFSEEAKRDAALPSVKDALDQCSVKAYLLVTLRYAGSNKAVIHPFAIYVVPARVNKDVWQKLSEQVELTEEISAEDPNFAFLVEQYLSISVHRIVGYSHDEYSIGYPERYFTMIHTGWIREDVVRHGMLESTQLATDDEIDALIGGVEGQNYVTFVRTSTPRLAAHWRDFRDSAWNSLAGNSVWSQDFERFSDWMEKENADGSVSIRIYNPMSLPIALMRLFGSGDSRFVPEMEYWATLPESHEILVLTGFIEYWRKPSVKSLAELLGDIALSFTDFVLLFNLGEAWCHDAVLMHRMGLRYTTIMTRIGRNREPKIENLAGNRSVAEAAWRRRLTSQSRLERFARDADPVLTELLAEASRSTWWSSDAS